jgi:voltage-gated sodium channel
MRERAARVAESPAFQHGIVAVIVVTAVLAGLETSDALMARHGALVYGVEAVVQAIFAVEIAIRILAHWPRVGRFLADGWNVFDLAVVVASFLPESGAFAMVARLARLLRVTRLVGRSAELRLIVATMLRSIPSMGHVLLMLALLLYVYGILGVHLFRDIDHDRWGALSRAWLTLFQMLTLEGWVEVQDAVLDAMPWAWMYFASFVFIAVFVVVNLFIAVVINNLEAAKREHQAEADRRSPRHAILEAIDGLRDRLDELERQVRGPEPGADGHGHDPGARPLRRTD